MSDLERFLERDRERLDRDKRIVAWHVAVHLNTEIELPYRGNETYMNVNVHRWIEDDGEYKMDMEATLANLAKITKYATSKGAKVEKKYDYDFKLNVTIPETDIVIRYSADRETVCTKKVVGTKHVEAQVIPAHDEEIIEWDCEPISLLQVATDEA